MYLLLLIILFWIKVKDKDAPGYSDIVTNRIAISDMKKKVIHGEYSNIQQLDLDISLMINNCQLYNIEGSLPYEVLFLLYSCYLNNLSGSKAITCFLETTS